MNSCIALTRQQHKAALFHPITIPNNISTEGMAANVLVSDYIVLAVFGGLLLAFVVFLGLRQWAKARRARKSGGPGAANTQAPNRCCSGSLLRRFGKSDRSNHPATAKKNEFTLA